MPFFWDASALAKRYAAEQGSATVNRLFYSVPLDEMYSTPWGYAETYSILLRRHNNGLIDRASFTVAVSALQAEIVEDQRFGLLSIKDETVFSGIFLLRKHNLNATDATLLELLKEVILETEDNSWVLVASDKRLLRAAKAEGIETLNPEDLAPNEVSAFLKDLSG